MKFSDRGFSFSRAPCPGFRHQHVPRHCSQDRHHPHRLRQAGPGPPGPLSGKLRFRAHFLAEGSLRVGWRRSPGQASWCPPGQQCHPSRDPDHRHAAGRGMSSQTLWTEREQGGKAQRAGRPRATIWLPGANLCSSLAGLRLGLRMLPTLGSAAGMCSQVQ